MSTSRRRFLVAGSAALTFAAGPRAHAQSAEAARKGKIDAMMQRAIDAGDVPGVVAMATDRNSVLYEGAFGKRVIGQPAAMTMDTVVWIASMTKALTAAGAMQLVEQGKLDLDAPAAKVVPDIATIEVLEGFDASGQPRTRPAKRAITLRHLLTHTPASATTSGAPILASIKKPRRFRASSPVRMQRCARRCCLSRANGGFMASTLTGPARWWRPLAAKSSGPTCLRICSRPSA